MRSTVSERREELEGLKWRYPSLWFDQLWRNPAECGTASLKDGIP
jgi:hypothetical protein